MKLKNHISKKRKDSSFSLLKTAAIYGGNASGKSNLVKAIDFYRNFIVDGSKGLAAFSPFKLVADSFDAPSQFEAEIRLSETAYAYGFVLRRRKVVEEWLFEINADSEHPLYERTVGDDGKSNITLAPRFFKGQLDEYKDSETKGFFRFIETGLLPDELFLTACSRNNVLSIPHITELSQYLRNQLTVIFPSTVELSRLPSLHFPSEEAQKLRHLLHKLDANLSDISSIPISRPEIVSEIGLTRLSNILESLEVEDHDFVFISAVGQYKWFIIDKTNSGRIEYFKLKTVHISPESGENVYFELTEESDGTRRLFDLLPILLSSDASPSTFVVDELDRSLHPLMVIEFMRLFHEHNVNRDVQLIFTTHEDTLFNLEYLRADEFWLMDNVKGASVLTPLSDFNIRSDKQISRGYMYGRYGGVPQLDSGGLARVAK